MGKAVLISIQPQWCEKIFNQIGVNENGSPIYEKSVEVRKSSPKLKTPFPVYIYQTKKTWVYNLYSKIANWQGKVIGEFVCKKIDRIGRRGLDNNFDYCYLSLDVFGNDDIEVEITDIKKSCILKKELNLYGEKANCLYAWHISNLVIYDEPKELCEFYNYDPTYNNAFGWAFSEEEKRTYLKRPPQSWCYVEELR